MLCHVAQDVTLKLIKRPHYSPVFDEEILEGLVSFGPWCGEAALHQCREALHSLLWLHPEEQGVVQAELGRGAVGLREL